MWPYFRTCKSVRGGARGWTPGRTCERTCARGGRGSVGIDLLGALRTKSQWFQKSAGTSVRVTAMFFVNRISIVAVAPENYYWGNKAWKLLGRVRHMSVVAGQLNHAVDKVCIANIFISKPSLLLRFHISHHFTTFCFHAGTLSIPRLEGLPFLWLSSVYPICLIV